MRQLTSAPSSVLDPAGAPAIGSYRGAVPRIDLDKIALGRVGRLVREKRWIYGAIATSELYVGFAVIDLGYATSAFAYAYLRGATGLVVDRSVIGPPLMGRVRQTSRLRYGARMDYPRGTFRVEQRHGERAIHVAIRVPGLVVHAELDAADAVAPPSLTAIAAVTGGILNTTEKRALLPTSGYATIAGVRYSLDGALGGYDYTHGLLARHTAWKWAFLLGNAKGGTPVAMNLVQGFVGEPECGLWLGREVIPLAEGRFTHDPARPLDGWRIRTADEAVDLAFTPGGIHAEQTNLGVVSSRFVQPVGTYSGTIRVPGRPDVVVENVLGVSEDQDVRW